MDSIQPQKTQFNYNVTFEINWKIIDGNIHLNYIFFAVQDTDNWKSRCVADRNNDFELTITQQYSS